MEFFQETYVSADDAEAIARGLLTVARADGEVHEREAAMILSFVGASTDAGSQALASLDAAGELSPEHAAAVLSRPDLAQLFLKSCILLGYADGDFSAKERAVIDSYAKALKVDASVVAKLEQGVKEYLLGQLAHLQNVDAAAQVAKDLKI